jgi:NAD-dependent dihydropyrimidine dehydrogenase PreA subunit
MPQSYRKGRTAPTARPARGLTVSLTPVKIAPVTGVHPYSESVAMAYVIAEPCIGTMDRGCVDVCPVDCIYEGEDQLYIHPDECIDCGACEPECPVNAIFPEEDVPEEWQSFIAKNRRYFETGEERQVAHGRGG